MLVNTPSLDSAKYSTATAISSTTHPMSEMRKLNFITDQGSTRSSRSWARRVCGPVAVPGVILACGRAPPGLGGSPGLPGFLGCGLVFGLDLVLAPSPEKGAVTFAARPRAALAALSIGPGIEPADCEPTTCAAAPAISGPGCGE